MDQPKPGFTQSPTPVCQGPQQASGIEDGRTLDSQAVGTDNAAMGSTQSVDGVAGTIPFGNQTQQ
jgi:hypothetical protein